MFFYKEDLVRRIEMSPKFIGKKNCDIKKVVKKLTRQNIHDHSFTEETGYVIDLVAVEDIGKGLCLPHTGLIQYTVRFSAIVLYPIIGEVITAEVVSVTENSITFHYVCMYGVVRTFLLNDPADFEFQEESSAIGSSQDDSHGHHSVLSNKGFLVSKSDEEKVIRPGTIIQLKITKRTIGPNGFFLIGSMSGEYLGPLKNTSLLRSIKAPEEGGVKDQLKTVNTRDDQSQSGEAVPMEDLQKLWKENPYNTGQAPNSPLPVEPDLD